MRGGAASQRAPTPGPSGTRTRTRMLPAAMAAPGLRGWACAAAHSSTCAAPASCAGRPMLVRARARAPRPCPPHAPAAAPRRRHRRRRLGPPPPRTSLRPRPLHTSPPHPPFLRGRWRAVLAVRAGCAVAGLCVALCVVGTGVRRQRCACARKRRRECAAYASPCSTATATAPAAADRHTLRLGRPAGHQQLRARQAASTLRSRWQCRAASSLNAARACGMASSPCAQQLTQQQRPHAGPSVHGPARTALHAVPRALRLHKLPGLPAAAARRASCRTQQCVHRGPRHEPQGAAQRSNAQPRASLRTAEAAHDARGCRRLGCNSAGCGGVRGCAQQAGMVGQQPGGRPHSAKLGAARAVRGRHVELPRTRTSPPACPFPCVQPSCGSVAHTQKPKYVHRDSNPGP